jgi:hypothetical protein
VRALPPVPVRILLGVTIVVAGCLATGAREAGNDAAGRPGVFSDYIGVRVGLPAETIRFRGTVKEAIDARALIVGAPQERGPNLILCDHVGGECSTARKYSPVIVSGRVRFRDSDDPQIRGGGGARWILEECVCEVSPDAWVPLTEREVQGIRNMVHERDTLSASEHWHIPLAVCAQVRQGRPAAELDPFAADPERTHESLAAWMSYWVIESTNDSRRNRFVEPGAR